MATTWSHMTAIICWCWEFVEDMVLAQNEGGIAQGGYVTASGGRATVAAKPPAWRNYIDKSLLELAAEIRGREGRDRANGLSVNTMSLRPFPHRLFRCPRSPPRPVGMFDVKSCLLFRQQLTLRQKQCRRNSEHNYYECVADDE